MSASESSTIRLQLVGARAAIAELGATAAAVGDLAKAETEQGLAAEKSGLRQKVANQALFTLHRYAYAGTLALTAFIAESLRWGYQFNQVMASSRQALVPVMGSVQAVNSELVELYNFTKRTPFQFKDVTIAFRQMYGAFHPLGISVEDTKQTLFSLINALSYAGRTTPGALNRVAVALQHMALMGRLTGQTVIQLARDGLPIYPVLQKELGLTGDQLHRVGSLGLSTAVVLKAINKYISETPGYMNAAARQAQTFGGQLTTLKDNIAQMMGALTLGSYAKGPTFLNSLNNVFGKIGDQIQKNATAGKGMSVSWDFVVNTFEKAYPWTVYLFRAINLLSVYVKALAGIVTNSLLPAFKNAMVVLLPLYGLLVLVGEILTFLAHHGTILTVVLTILIARWLFMKEIMLVVWTYGRLLDLVYFLMGVRLAVATAWTERLTLAQLNQAVVVGNLTKLEAIQPALVGKLKHAYELLGYYVAIFNGGVVRNTAGRFAAMSTTEKLARAMGVAFRDAGGGVLGFAAAIRVATGAMVTFLLTNPVGWIILVIAALGILYWKWGWFRTFVNAFATEFAHRVMLVVRSFEPLVEVLKIVWSWLGRILDRMGWFGREAHKVGNFFSGILGHLGLGGISASKAGKIGADAAFNYLFPIAGIAQIAGGRAEGGPVSSTGTYWVGERGPELLTLPGGSHITPNNGLRWPDLNITIPVKIDGKKLGEANAKIRLDAAARA